MSPSDIPVFAFKARRRRKIVNNPVLHVSQDALRFSTGVNGSRGTHLLKALLADGLRIDLYLEDDRIGLTDEAPHPREYASLDDLRIPVLIPRRRHPATSYLSLSFSLRSREQ